MNIHQISFFQFVIIFKIPYNLRENIKTNASKVLGHLIRSIKCKNDSDLKFDMFLKYCHQDLRWLTEGRLFFNIGDASLVEQVLQRLLPSIWRAYVGKV